MYRALNIESGSRMVSLVEVEYTRILVYREHELLMKLLKRSGTYGQGGAWSTEILAKTQQTCYF